MRLLLRIARTELATLFYSPVAWFILIVFSFLAGKDFASIYDALLRTLELGSFGERKISATVYLIGGNQGLLKAVQNNLYMFMPLITMGVMSREYSSGSIKLLYSSPVRGGHIVLGKYAAMMLYSALLMIVPILCTVWASFCIPNFDWGAALAALLGVYLLVCTYAAIGVFMSSLTSYQVVAAVTTLAVFTALRFVGRLWQEYDAVRQITHWLSINGRSDYMLNGLISSADVLYFVIVIWLFLGLTMLRVGLGRSGLRWPARALRYGAVAAAALAVGWISSHPGFIGYFDATRGHQLTLSATSQQVLAQVQGPVSITHYVNMVDEGGRSYMPRGRAYGEGVFRMYTRFKPDIDIKYLYYWDEVPGSPVMERLKTGSWRETAERLAGIQKYPFGWFKTPEQMAEIEDLKPFDNKFVRIVEFADGRRQVLRDFADMSKVPGEQEVTTMFQRALSGAVRVGFSSSHGERDIKLMGDRTYRLFANDPTQREGLLNQGFDFFKTVGTDSLDILVVADPRSLVDTAAIGRFLDDGGNMMVLAEPSGREFTAPLLARLGVEMMPGVLTDSLSNYEPTLTLAIGAGSFADLSGKVSMPEAGELRFNAGSSRAGFAASAADSWQAEPILTRGAQTVALLLTRGEQQVIVVGDADFLSNAELTIGRMGYSSANFRFAKEAFTRLAGGRYPLDTRKAAPLDDRITAPLESVGWTRIAFMAVCPIFLLTVALVTSRRRRRH